jgi:cation/acetate symporter
MTGPGSGTAAPGEADAGPTYPIGTITRLPNGEAATGPIGPLAYIATIQNSEMVKWKPVPGGSPADPNVTYTPVPTTGADFLVPGAHPLFAGVRSDSVARKLDFISLMIALFAGTASLPHILIRYYTVKDAAAARKSTVVGIASIGFFYVLTLYLGLGAMTSLPPTTDTNMAAPLLARQFGEILFAAISAIAFTTVLGTVSGLILAASGRGRARPDAQLPPDGDGRPRKVRAGKLAAVVVGVIAMVLGIVFKNFNAGFLVGWAFNVAPRPTCRRWSCCCSGGARRSRASPPRIVVGLLSLAALARLHRPRRTRTCTARPQARAPCRSASRRW